MNGLGRFQQAASNPAPVAASREGVLSRMDMLAVGLYDLHRKLLGFGDRLSGGGLKEEPPGGHPLGIDGALSAAETRLRECHQLVDGLHKAF
jgi:hypothetical protein